MLLTCRLAFSTHKLPETTVKASLTWNSIDF
jgi:hypothetical protein